MIGFKMAYLKCLIIVVLSFVTKFASCDSDVRLLSEDNWTDILEGEWFVKFYAPWCPACRSLTATWETVAAQLKELNVLVGEVDVTNNPALSGRFFVTALPTIFHIKDGVFRQYKEARTEENFYKFVAENKWQSVEPLPWYQSPTSIHMSFLGMFFRFSLAIKDLHSAMMNDYGIPVWASYVLFAVFTILLGLVIGLVIVCLCDLRQPASPARRPATKSEEPNSKKVSKKTDDLSDIDEDDNRSSDSLDKPDDEAESTVRHREAKSSDD